MRGWKEERERKIIAAVANPISLSYVNDICSQKDALENLNRMWQKGAI